MHDFKPNDVVVHPNHGIGTIGRVSEIEVDGGTERFLVVDFRRTALTLSIPERTLDQCGLRRVSSKETMRAALAVLPAQRASLSGHWSRWSNIYLAKLNSGKPEQLAEVLRDLTAMGGSWKARLYEEALKRFAEELALVEDISLEQAQQMIETQLPAEA